MKLAEEMEENCLSWNFNNSMEILCLKACMGMVGTGTKGNTITNKGRKTEFNQSKG